MAQTTASGGGATPLFLGRGEGKKKTVDGLVCNYRKVKRAFRKLKFPLIQGSNEKVPNNFRFMQILTRPKDLETISKMQKELYFIEEKYFK